MPSTCLLETGTPLVLHETRAYPSLDEYDARRNRSAAEKRARADAARARRDAKRAAALADGVPWRWLPEYAVAPVQQRLAEVLSAVTDDLSTRTSPAARVLLDTIGNTASFLEKRNPEPRDFNVPPLSLWPSLIARLVQQHGLQRAVTRLETAHYIAESGEIEHAERFLKCCNHGVIETRPAAGHGPDATLEQCEYRVRPVWCRSRLCPECARRRNATIRANMMAAYDTMSDPAMLTLTVRHSITDSLADLLDHLQKSFDRLRRTRGFQNGSKHCSQVFGGFRIVEIKHGKNGWHPHIHCLIDCKYMHPEYIRRQWHRITGDSWEVMFDRLKHNDEDRKKTRHYVTKYLSKPQSEHISLVEEYAEATRGRRLVSAFGSMSEVNLLANAREPEEETGWSKLAHVDEVICYWLMGDEQAAQVLTWSIRRDRWQREADAAEEEKPPERRAA